jgi:hypothetical protein
VVCVACRTVVLSDSSGMCMLAFVAATYFVCVCVLTCSCDQAGYLVSNALHWNLTGAFDNEEERMAVERLGFLFLAYRPSMWWFEIAEMLRKLMMVCDCFVMCAGVFLRETL